MCVWYNLFWWNENKLSLTKLYLRKSTTLKIRTSREKKKKNWPNLYSYHLATWFHYENLQPK